MQNYVIVPEIDQAKIGAKRLYPEWSGDMLRNRILKRVLMLAMTVMTFGCAPKAAEINLIYPSFPEEPRIVYLKTYTGETIYRESSVLDIFFGTPVSFIGQLYGVAAKGDKVYAAVFRPPAVVVFDDKERRVSYIGDSGPGSLSQPTGVVIAADGSIFVADAPGKKIQVYNPEGVHKRSIGKKDEFATPAGLAINNEMGRLYVADSRAHAVKVFSLQGEKLFEFGKPGTGNGEFNGPTNVAVDQRNGKVSVVDTINNRVQVFDKDGKFLLTYGTIGDAPGQFSRPKGIGIDSEGNAYVMDSVFGNFQIFDESGQLLLAIGNYGTGPGEFTYPAGLYVDERDRIFVADSGNHRIQSFQYLSAKWKQQHPEEYKKYVRLQAEAKEKKEKEAKTLNK